MQSATASDSAVRPTIRHWCAIKSANVPDNEAVTVSDSQSLYQSLATNHVIMHRIGLLVKKTLTLRVKKAKNAILWKNKRSDLVSIKKRSWEIQKLF